MSLCKMKNNVQNKETFVKLISFPIFAKSKCFGISLRRLRAFVISFPELPLGNHVSPPNVMSDSSRVYKQFRFYPICTNSEFQRWEQLFSIFTS